MPRIGVAISPTLDLSVAPGPRPQWDPANSPDIHLRSSVDVSGDPVDSWANNGSVGDSWTATTTLRPTVGSVGPDASVDFDGSDDRLESGGAAGTYKEFHTGDGAAMIAVLKPSGTTGASETVISTGRPVGARGTTLAFEDSNDSMRVWIIDGSGNYQINGVMTEANSVPPGAPALLTLRVDAAAPNQIEMRINGVLAHAQAFDNPASSGDESGPTRLGLAAGAGGFPFGSQLLEVVGWLSSVSNVDIAAEEQAAMRYYDFANVVDILGLGQSNLGGNPALFAGTIPVDIDGPDIFVSSVANAVKGDVTTTGASLPGMGVVLGRISRQLIDKGRKRVRWATGIQGAVSITTMIPVTGANYLAMQVRAAQVDLAPKAFIFYQGEDDSGMEQSVYEGHLGSILDAILVDFPTVTKRIVVQTADTACGNGAANDSTRAAQAAAVAARPGVVLVNVDDIWATYQGPGPNECHFLIDGYDAIGRRLAPLIDP